MLEAKGIRYSINHTHLLNDVDFQLTTGEFVAILGANGAGKSTLVKNLTGELTPNAGEITINGVSLNSLSKKALAQIRAIMPQSNPLTFPFRAKEVVAMGRTPFELGSPAEEARLTQHCLSLTGCEHLANRLYPLLSGGEKQRVQLARVLNQVLHSQEKKKYLLLDECTANLDPAYQHHVFNLLRNLVGPSLGIVAVVHDINLAAQYCHRVVMMKAGQITHQGAVKERLNEDALADVYNLRTQLLNHPQGEWPLVVALEQEFSWLGGV